MKTAKQALAVLEGSAAADGSEKPTNRTSIGPQRAQYRVMDDLARKRRLKAELDLLERDNFHDDPHANLTLSKKVPKFDGGLKAEDRSTEKRRSNVRLKLINLAQLIDEDSKRPPPNYTTALVPPPEHYNITRRHFCAVCGFTGRYTCITCGARFCNTNCQTTHKETRCMKWIA